MKILLLDNQRLGLVRQWQTLFFRERHSHTILEDNPDFVMLAKAFNIEGERIERCLRNFRRNRPLVKLPDVLDIQ